MKLLRTIRLDPSDTFVFERAAEPGEWAVPGSFCFSQTDIGKLEGKARAAFRSGFLGVGSLGWSTLVQVVDASADDREAAVETLARQLVDSFGAPDVAVARLAAEEEIAFTSALSEHPTGMVVALARKVEEGAIREVFRTITPGIGHKPIRAYEFLQVVGEDDAPVEKIDLRALAKGNIDG